MTESLASPPPLTRAAACTAFRRALRAWYERHRRDLPWRRTRDPYCIWVSEILLQQTRVETALGYYERFVAALPDVQALAAAPLDRVLKLWEGAGYYSRARNLHKAAQQVVAERGGRLPTSAAAWAALPGVGRYTAAAIASISADEAVAAVDGNIKRVLVRLFRVELPINAPAAQTEFWRLADQLLARQAPGSFNQAMMELGARICTPRLPACGACPVPGSCAAYQAGVVEHLPVRRVRPPAPQVHSVAAVLERGGRYLLVKRPENGLLGGLWEFPAQHCAPSQNGEDPADAAPAALLRHLEDGLGVNATLRAPVGALTHVFTHFRLRQQVFLGEAAGGRARRGPYAAVRWVRWTELDTLALTRLTRRTLALLQQRNGRISD